MDKSYSCPANLVPIQIRLLSPCPPPFEILCLLLEIEPFSSPSGNDKCVPAISHQSYAPQPPDEICVNSARESLQFLCTIRSGQLCYCSCQGGSADLVNVEITAGN